MMAIKTGLTEEQGLTRDERQYDLTKEEYAYLSGNKGPNTFSSNYCDYGNLISLTKLYLKIERVWKEMNNE